VTRSLEATAISEATTSHARFLLLLFRITEEVIVVFIFSSIENNYCSRGIKRAILLGFCAWTIEFKNYQCRFLAAPQRIYHFGGDNMPQKQQKGECGHSHFQGKVPKSSNIDEQPGIEKNRSPSSPFEVIVLLGKVFCKELQKSLVSSEARPTLSIAEAMGN